jgi:hypothetical protein
MGHIRSLYSFNLVFWDMTLELKSEFAKYAWFAIMILEHMSANILFSFFTTDTKYVKVSMHVSQLFIHN